MNELALFAGAGGGLLAGGQVGFHTVCAVELSEFCRDVLLRRQSDGHLPLFPIWDDVCTFDARPWRGCVDIVTGGFPCQPFSSASRGRRVAVDLWPEMLRIVREVDSPWVFAENVSRHAIDKACDDLEALGYHTAATKLGSADVGAPTLRARYWMVARADSDRQSELSLDAQVARVPAVAGPLPWPDPPRELGVADGLARRMDRLGALGNGQVPRVAAAAFRILCDALSV